MSNETVVTWAIRYNDGDLDICADEEDAREEFARCQRLAASKNAENVDLYGGAELMTRTVTTITGPWKTA